MSKVDFRAVSPYSNEHINRNVEHAKARGLAPVSQFPDERPLAVVGGGYSILGYVETLRRWEGPVWAINGAHRWCRENGIDACFFSIDPNPIVADMADGAHTAILAERCDPSAFDEPRAYYTYAGTLGGCSSAGAAICAALQAGVRQVTLFGCESNHQQQRSHAYAHHQPPHELIVKCCGMHFLTTPTLALQAKELAIMILEAQGVVRETSGGFLRAMVNANCEYDIVACTEGFEETLSVAAS
jgi:hypothetical protein